MKMCVKFLILGMILSTTVLAQSKITTLRIAPDSIIERISPNTTVFEQLPDRTRKPIKVGDVFSGKKIFIVSCNGWMTVRKVNDPTKKCNTYYSTCSNGVSNLASKQGILGKGKEWGKDFQLFDLKLEFSPREIELLKPNFQKQN